MKKITPYVGAFFLCAASLTVSSTADARKIVGGSEEPEESEEEKEKREEKEKKAAEKAEKKAAEKAERKRKKREAKQKKAEEAERKRELAEEAAERAREEAEEKKKEAKRKKEEEKKRKVEERKAQNKDARLKNAKSARFLTRDEGNYRIVTTLLPGAVKSGKVLEVRFDVGTKLEVAHPKYGNIKPQKGLRMIAIVDDGTEKKTYLVHPLKAAGAYGFHHTPSADGEISVRLEYKEFQSDTTVHVGAWPPPDFEDEEANNAKMSASSSARKVIK